MNETNLKSRIDELNTRWILVGTNQGTYSSADAHRVIGTGDQAYADCFIYQQVGTGKTRTDGCNADKAPGYIRRFSKELTAAQQELAALRKQQKG